MRYFVITLELLSDTTFGRGDGVAGVVDVEVQHDAHGCPFLQGRALKGMLVQECADILAALPQNSFYRESAKRLFGEPGSALHTTARLSISDARLPADLRSAIAADKPSREAIIHSLTTLRRQTAIETSGKQRGVAKAESLRTSRVILRGTPFESELALNDMAYSNNEAGQAQMKQDIALLSACVKAFRRAGTGRTRGRGKVQAKLWQQNTQSERVEALQAFEDFKRSVQA